jgi:transcriptional regulator with XRE-family HTH domain
MATICVKIGRRIRVLRTARGWTQAILADHAEIAREHLSELENGHKEIGAKTLERIAQALEVKLSEFFDGI